MYDAVISISKNTLMVDSFENTMALEWITPSVTVIFALAVEDALLITSQFVNSLLLKIKLPEVRKLTILEFWNVRR